MELVEAIRALLDKLESEGKPTPSLRAIRAEVGRGSLTTISDTVKAWKLERLQRVTPLPIGFDAAASEALAAGVWKLIQPVLNQLYDSAQAAANARIDLETKEAQKLRDAAAEMLAEVESKTAEFDSMRAELESVKLQLAQTEQSLKGTSELLVGKTQEIDDLTKQLRDALERASSAEARCDTMRKLIPLLDSQHVKGNSGRM